MEIYTNRIANTIKDRDMLLTNMVKIIIDKSSQDECIYSPTRYFPNTEEYNYSYLYYSICYSNIITHCKVDLKYLTSKPLSFECFYLNIIANTTYKEYIGYKKDQICLVDLLKPKTILKKGRVKKIPLLYMDKYRSYITRSKKKNNEFKLDYNTFITILEKSCVYCGTSPANTIDRIDSNKGYIEGNVQPCCKTCNTMKWNLTEDVFKNHVNKIYSFLKMN